MLNLTTYLYYVAAKYLTPDILLDTFSHVEAYRAGIAILIKYTFD